METVERETFLPAPLEDVWASVADLGQWLGASVDGAVEEGECIHIGDRRAVVERVDETRRLTFRYVDDDASRVDITLAPFADGTVVRVIERRIASAVDSEQTFGFQALARV